jgi:hypothetical protein
MVAEFDMNLIENILWLDDQARLGLATPGSGRSARKLGSGRSSSAQEWAGWQPSAHLRTTETPSRRINKRAHCYEHRRHCYLRIAC